MTTSAHRPRGTASDALLLQVHVGNVLQVRAAYLRQRDAVDTAVVNARRDFSLRPCGGDPVSNDYTPEFQSKLTAIADVHERHVRELDDAIERLEDAAREYGLTEDQIRDSFSGTGRWLEG